MSVSQSVQELFTMEDMEFHGGCFVKAFLHGSPWPSMVDVSGKARV
jgi:hypothetical protein